MSTHIQENCLWKNGEGFVMMVHLSVGMPVEDDGELQCVTFFLDKEYRSILTSLLTLGFS